MKVFGILAFCAVAWLSLSPRPLPNRDLQDLLHPYEHVAMFAAFSLICFLVWPGRGRVVLGCLVAVAVLLEAVQELVPVRAFQLDDLAMNLSGVAIGAVLAYAFRWSLSQLRARS